MGTPVTGPVNAVDLMQSAVRAGEVSHAVADRLLGSMCADHPAMAEKPRRAKKPRSQDLRMATT